MLMYAVAVPAFLGCVETGPAFDEKLSTESMGGVYNIVNQVDGDRHSQNGGFYRKGP